MFLQHIAYFTYVSCRKEIALRKEKNRELLSIASLQTPSEPLAAVTPAETRPLVAKDQVAWLGQSCCFPTWWGGDGCGCPATQDLSPLRCA